MPTLTDKELEAFPEPVAADVVPRHVARYRDMMAIGQKTPVTVIGENGLLPDRPGFEVDFLTRGSAPSEMHAHDRPCVLMPMRGHWKLTWDGGAAVLNPGDTASVPDGCPTRSNPR